MDTDKLLAEIDGLKKTLASVIAERDALARVILEMVRDQESKKPRVQIIANWAGPELHFE